MQELSEHRLKNILEIAIGLIVSAVIIYFTIVSLGKLNLSQLLSEKLNWWLAGISALVFGLSSLARGFVYTYGIDKEIHWFNAWRITAVGNAANMVTPLRMGEGLRLALFPRGYKAGRRARLIIIPAIADIAVILLLSLIAVWLAGFNNPQILKVLSIVSIIFFIVGAVIVVILFIIPRTKKIVKNNFNKNTLFMTMWVLISWLLVLLSIYFGFLCLGFDFILSIRYSLACFVCMNIITFIPSSPGGIGLFEILVPPILQSMGVAYDPANAVVLLLRCSQYAIMLPLGIVLLLAGLHKHVKKLRRKHDKHSLTA
jgi:uncharacterized membrane protein YbhN (UPF0104 family)